MVIPSAEQFSDSHLESAGENDQHLRVNTAIGEFLIHLKSDVAPITSAYFRQLARDGALDSSAIFRIVSPRNTVESFPGPDIEVVQIGTREGMSHNRDRIAHESTQLTGLQHRQWTVSAARFEAGELYRSFFVCMRNEPSLDFGGKRSPDGLGFAAFGAVIEGFETLIQAFEMAEDSELLSRHLAVHSVTPSP